MCYYHIGRKRKNNEEQEIKNKIHLLEKSFTNNLIFVTLLNITNIV